MEPSRREDQHPVPPAAPGSDAPVPDVRGYWRANVTLIAVLLSVWAAVSFGMAIVLAPLVQHLYVGQLPMGFWFGHQGAIVVFVVLIFVYALAMDRLDRRYGVKE